MKGHPKIIEVLNSLLIDEFAARHQYMAHAEVSKNWGYTKLAEYQKHTSQDEQVHAEKLLARIIFLEGKPIMDKFGAMNVAYITPQQLKNDVSGELAAIDKYNAAIRVAFELGDHTTRQLLSLS